jgi:hypothetical protein
MLSPLLPKQVWLGIGDAVAEAVGLRKLPLLRSCSAHDALCSVLHPLLPDHPILVATVWLGSGDALAKAVCHALCLDLLLRAALCIISF